VITGVVSYMLLYWGGGGDAISTSPHSLCILYITLIARMSKPDDGHYRPKHIVFYC